MAFKTSHRARPILKWAGGKSGPLPHLVGHFPKQFSRYVEPFLGGGAVFLALEPGVPAVLNDKNPELIELYQVVRNYPDRLMAALDSLRTHYSEDFYYQVRGAIPNDPVDRAARTVFLNKTGFNGLFRQNAKGAFNVPFGKRAHCPILYDRANLVVVSERFQSAELTCADFESVLACAGPGDFVYCDPPYEPVSRTSAFTAYTAGGFGRLEQERLEKACRRAVAQGAFVAVSNSHTPFTNALFQGWHKQEILVNRPINSKASERGPVKELLVTLGY